MHVPAGAGRPLQSRAAVRHRVTQGVAQRGQQGAHMHEPAPVDPGVMVYAEVTIIGAASGSLRAAGSLITASFASETALSASC